MGITVEFLLGSPDGIQGHFLSGPIKEFYDWYQAGFDESLDKKRDPRVTQLIADVLLHGEKALSVTTLEQAVIMDKMMNAYYGHFCDSVRPDQTIHAILSFVNVSRYKPLLDMLTEHCGSQALPYLTYIFSGRGVGRQNDLFPYQPEDDVFRLGYWTALEVEDFLQCLSQDTIPQSSIGTEYDIKIALENAREKNTGIIILVA